MTGSELTTGNELILRFTQFFHRLQRGSSWFAKLIHRDYLKLKFRHRRAGKLWFTDDLDARRLTLNTPVILTVSRCFSGWSGRISLTRSKDEPSSEEIPIKIISQQRSNQARGNY